LLTHLSYVEVCLCADKNDFHILSNTEFTDMEILAQWPHDDYT